MDTASCARSRSRRVSVRGPFRVAAVPGALTGSTDTAMRFKGATGSTYVTLPETAISGQGGNLAVEAWFKTTGSGTVIGYQNSAVSTPTAFTPGIYVGTDGKLRGRFYTDRSAPITSSTRVNDGVWHHVVLSGAQDTQTLHLDGRQVGTLAGEISHAGQWETRVGSGFGSSAWPVSTGSTAAFPFAGEIDEVAVYGKPLGAHPVKLHYAARSPQPQLTKAVTRTGRTETENAYAGDGGRLSTCTDANGGVWKPSPPAYTKETNFLTFATTTVIDPRGGTTAYVDDAQRGNRPVSQTDQLGQTTRYAYDTGGFPAKVVDPNGNVTEVAFNSRGNMLSKKTCRTADTCFTEYFSYYLKIDDPFDSRNDLKTGHRDARSSSPMDDTYLTSWTFNGFGEEIKQTTPATQDFPAGRAARLTRMPTGPYASKATGSTWSADRPMTRRHAPRARSSTRNADSRRRGRKSAIWCRTFTRPAAPWITARYPGARGTTTAILPVRVWPPLSKDVCATTFPVTRAEGSGCSRSTA
ncbi:LamG domain-containing protein [Nonomuraea rhodomycinica]|uniref:LamG-like jellyroll fold domain-containing protein n=1 Tax=Nonomuraea rhodomycinica TaxID=1712872 RepID=A0A7Y6MCM9_9ACTN|nr:LamG-like jellyroll fold domain-containing protein [Nonomuraea rhodomycinica]NUW41926.1 hypothetical protein [Nonomuraea rhodomycinica]